jgi:hypothetical protein
MTPDTDRTELLAIVYFAVRLCHARGRIPPDVARHAAVRRCGRCHSKVVLDPVAFRHSLDLGQRTGRRVILACDRCCRRLEPNLVATPPAHPAITAACRQHTAATKDQ